MRNFKFSMPVRIISLVVAMLLLTSLFPTSIFATDKDVAAVGEVADVAPISESTEVPTSAPTSAPTVGEEPDVADISNKSDVAEVGEEITAGYYLVGNLNGQSLWNNAPLENNRKLIGNSGQGGEYMLDWTFYSGDELKVVYYNGTNIETWYGSGDNYVVRDDEVGACTLYFRPEGNSEWTYYNYIYLAKKTDEPAITFKYSVDGKALSSDGQGNLNWTTKDVKVEFEVAEGYTVSKVEGANLNADKKSFTVSCDANKTINKAYAITVEKNGEEKTVSTDTIRIDKVAPVISEIKYTGADGNELTPDDGNLPWTNQNVTVKFTVADEGSGVGTVIVKNEDGSRVTLNRDGRSFTVECEDAEYLEKTYKITAKDKAGNDEKKTIDTATIRIDKVAPVISEIKYTDSDGNELTPDTGGKLPWTNQNVTVKFTVTDTGSGVSEIAVKDADGKSVTLNADNRSFTVKCADSLEKTYKITATDNAWNSAIKDTAKVRIDKVEPEISKITYTDADGNELTPDDDGKLKWTNQNVKVGITVTEKHSGVGNITVKDEDGNNVAISKENTFTVKCEDAKDLERIYTITVKDKAGNDTKEAKSTATIFIDKICPVAEAFIFDKTAKTVLTFLSFGVYANEEEGVQVTVRAIDEESGLAEVSLYCDEKQVHTVDKELEAMVNSGRSYATFTLKGAYSNLVAKAKDNAGNTSNDLSFTDHLKYFGSTDDEANLNKDWFDNAVEASYDQATFDECTPDEIVVSNEQPTIKFTPVFPIDENGNVTGKKVPIDGEEFDWYNCGISVKIDIATANTKLKKTSIEVDAPDYDFAEESDFTKVATTSQQEDITYRGDGHYKIDVTADSVNNTETVEKTYEYNIDTIAPKISEIKYTDSEGKVLTPADGKLPWTNKDVTLSFTIKEQGSGIKEITIGDEKLTAEKVENGEYYYSYSTDVKNVRSLVKTFTISATDNVKHSIKKDTDEVRIDKIKPVVNTFTFNKTAKTAISFLTFGIYSCNDIEVKVNVTDAGNSSGIKSVKLYDGKTLLGSMDYDGTKSTVNPVFTLAQGKYTNINAVATDIATNSSGTTTMTEVIDDEGKSHTYATYDEIVVSDEQPVITLTHPEDEVVTIIDNMPWYSEDVQLGVSVSAPKTKLQNVAIELNKADITNAVVGKHDYSAKPISDVSGDYTVNKDGAYTIGVKAQSNNNTPAVEQSYTFSLDKTAPEISKITYIDADGNKLTPDDEGKLPWTNKDVTLSFTVKEQGSGIKEVTIDGKKLDPVSESDGVYSYVYDVNVKDADSLDYVFGIRAEDMVGYSDETYSAAVRIDKIKPVISEIKYTDSNEKELTPGSDVLPWTNKDATLSFTVTEQDSGIKEVTIDGKKLDPVSESDGVYSYVYDVNVKDADSLDYVFGIRAEDMVGYSDETYSAEVRIDKIKPVVNTFTFNKTAKTAISFLTFGIYSCNDIEVKVNVTDAGNSSGIKSVKLYDGKTLLGSMDYDGTKPTVNPVFTLTQGKYTNINAVATDIATNSSGTTTMIKAIDDEGKSHTYATYDEIVVSDEQPNITLTHPENEVVKVIDNMPWYKADVKLGVSVEAPKTKLQNVAINHNTEDITDVVIGKHDYSAKPISDVSGDYTVYKDGKHTVIVKAQSNNNTPEVLEYYTFSLDKTAPEISDVKYYTLSTEIDKTTQKEIEKETEIKPDSKERLAWTSNDVRIKFNVKEQGSGIQTVEIDGKKLDPVSEEKGVYSYIYDVKVEDADALSYIFSLYAEDMVGYYHEMETAEVRIDKIDPAIEIISYKEAAVGGKELKPANGSLPWTNKDVTIEFIVTEDHSGINTVTIGNEAPELIQNTDGIYCYRYTKSVPVGGSFDQVLEIFAQDKVANDSSKNTAVINIDKIAPTIKVEYDNADHKVYKGDEYYKANRTATITVVERNFEPSKFELDITNTDGSIPSLSGWSVSGSHDSTTHTATVTFANDGDYTMTFDCVDAVGNKATEKPEMQKFTIDKTLPTVTVTFDNNNVLNEAYYSSDRVATITINEHNFAVDAEHLTVNVTATAGDNSTRVTPPSVVDWNHSGDVHTAKIFFTEDGSYEITVDFKDFAYNEAKQVVVDKFYIDETKPKIEFNQVEDMVAYGGVIAPQVIMTDNNYDTYTTFTLERIDINGKAINVDLYRSSTNNGDAGETITYTNFPEIELNDGIYRLIVRIVDKAGNEDSKEIMFSVNRFGSTYMAGDDSTNSLVTDGYTNAEHDIVIKEINVNKVSAQKMSLALNNTNISELKVNKDYSVRSVGGENSWYEYSYTVLKENFKEEGFYTLTLSSTDRVKHTVSNRTALTEERRYPVSFTVDKTLPGIRITGVEDNKPYKDAQRDVKVVYEDANIDAEKMTIRLNGVDLKAGEDYELNTDNAGEAIATFKVKAIGKNTKQKIEVIVVDKADNENTLSVSDFILSASWFRRFLANTGLAITVFSVLGVGIILLIILLAKKRKQEE